MRLFVAVELSPAVLTAAVDLVERLAAKAARVAPRSRITWIARERMHVTVRFIGHVVDAKAESIRIALQPSIGLDPFEVTVGGVGAFPVKGPPRVLWAGIGPGSEQLQTVERSVSARLAALGHPGEDRPFSPHLTLARIREAGGLRTRTLLDGLDDLLLGTVPVDAITLFESRLSPKGPTYLPLQRTPLA